MKYKVRSKKKVIEKRKKEMNSRGVKKTRLNIYKIVFCGS